MLHAKAVKDGTFRCLNVTNYLLSLLAKSHNFTDARKLFDEMLHRDVRSWTILISGFARSGYFRIFVELFRAMQSERVRPNEFTLSSALRSCSISGELRPGKSIHGWIVANGIELDTTLENTLLDLYVKSGEFRHAEKVFKNGTERDTVAWNIMIDGLMKSGDVKNSVSLFNKLPFRDVASWNTMIHGLMKNGQERTAFELLFEMLRNGPRINEVTLSSALVLASNLKLIKLGRQIHCLIIGLGVTDKGFLRTSLIGFYTKQGKMKEALSLSTTKENPNLLISGYVRNNDYDTALQTFTALIRDRFGIDMFTITTLVSRCESLSLGQTIHGFALKLGHRLDSASASSLIAMYSKNGSLRDARRIFEESGRPSRSVVVWSSMISALALHGEAIEAVELFDKMRIEPNEVSFLAVLTACSHAGLVDRGREYFRVLEETRGVNPTVEILTCMVDLFGRAGRLNEAKEFIEKHGIRDLSPVMKSFVSSCRIHDDAEMAKWGLRYLEISDPNGGSSRVLVANMFAARNRWEDSAGVRRSMQHRGIEKDLSISLVKR